MKIKTFMGIILTHQVDFPTSRLNLSESGSHTRKIFSQFRKKRRNTVQNKYYRENSKKTREFYKKMVLTFQKKINLENLRENLLHSVVKKQINKTMNRLHNYLQTNKKTWKITVPRTTIHQLQLNLLNLHLIKIKLMKKLKNLSVSKLNHKKHALSWRGIG
jgi:predicted RNA-binding protein